MKNSPSIAWACALAAATRPWRSTPARTVTPPFTRILSPTAPQQNGLAPRVVELLRRPNATAALSLLQMLRAMYEHHPRPKVGALRLLELFVGGRWRWQRRAGKRTRRTSAARLLVRVCVCSLSCPSACTPEPCISQHSRLRSVSSVRCSRRPAAVPCSPGPSGVHRQVPRAAGAGSAGTRAVCHQPGTPGAEYMHSLRHCCPLPCLCRRGCWQSCWQG